VNGDLEMSELGKEQLVSNPYYSWASIDKSDFCSGQKLELMTVQAQNLVLFKQQLQGM